MKKQIITFLCIAISAMTYSQNCSCTSEFNWVRNFFEQNDAGFQYAIEQKGLDNYNILNKQVAERIKSISDPNEGYHEIYNWLKFFRKGHLGIWANNAFDLKENDLDKNHKIDVNTSDFKNYLNSKSFADYEGIWSYGNDLKIGIKKQSNHYAGFVMDSKNKNLPAGQILFEIFQTGKNAFAVLYSRHRKQIVLNSVQLSSNKYLLLEFILLQRLEPKNISPRPELYKLNVNTYVLTIPSFEISYKAAIDSIIKDSFKAITSTKNLIIDIRNNGGGSTVSYDKLIPVLYTNPIRLIGLEILATKENAQRYNEQIRIAEKAGFSSEDKQGFIDIRDSLEKNSGHFVNMKNKNFSIYRSDSVYAFPENIGILINQNNGSAAEQFLLTAKQSRKVKLFGVSTMGEIDISNVWLVDSPCKDFKLAYAVSRSLRIPEMTVDQGGVQPDFYLDPDIPQPDWINYTYGILNAVSK